MLAFGYLCHHNVRYVKLFSLCDKYDRMSNEAYFFLLMLLPEFSFLLKKPLFRDLAIFGLTTTQLLLAYAKWLENLKTLV